VQNLRSYLIIYISGIYKPPKNNFGLFYASVIVLAKSTSTGKVKHVHNSAELGLALRDRRREQSTTISGASSYVALGERFISEVERGKQTAFFDKTLQYLSLLGLTLQIYPRNAHSIQSPYGAFTELKAIGALARHHRKEQKATLDTVRDLSGLSIRFLSNFERGNNSQIGKALAALKIYGLEVAISQRNYRLNKDDLLNA
jgi:HTH-type transcriptional regulator / antitoxin HipB